MVGPLLVGLKSPGMTAPFKDDALRSSNNREIPRFQSNRTGECDKSQHIPSRQVRDRTLRVEFNTHGLNALPGEQCRCIPQRRLSGGNQVCLGSTLRET